MMIIVYNTFTMNKTINATYRLKQLLTLGGDFVVYNIALVIAMFIRKFFNIEIDQLIILLPSFTFIFLIWITVNYINGLYDLSKNQTGFILQKRIFEVAIINTIVGVIFFYVTDNFISISPKTILVLTAIIGHEFIFILRSLTKKIFKKSLLLQNILFVGFNNETKELIENIKSNPGRGYKTVSIIEPRSITIDVDKKIQKYTELTKIRPAIQAHDVKLVVISPELQKEPAAMRELYELLFWDVQIADLTTFYEVITGRIPPITFSDAWFLNHLKNNKNQAHEHLSRMIDIISGAIIGVVFLLLFPLIAVLIKTTSKGPIFYKQKRVGKNGAHFFLYKLRSMYAISKDGGSEKNGAQFATKNDKRVTPIGKILRQTRIDELPQVLNLIKGDLTIIGPRPERPEIVDQLQSQMPYYNLRHIVKPGLTGWAAVTQHYTDTLEQSLQKLQYDLYYIKNRSLLLDISIILKTINVVFRMMGR